MFKDGILKSQRILVTGGGTGLGKEMAAKFLELGAEIFICGRRKSVCGATAAELTGKYGGQVAHLWKLRAQDTGTKSWFH